MEDKIFEKIEKDNVKFIQLQFSDILGIAKSLTIPVRYLSDALNDGTWFDGSSIEGFTRICESDMYLVPDIDTYSVIPWLNSEDGNTARFICNIYTPDGILFKGDPRCILKRVIAEAKKIGFVYNTGPELEFFLFKKENGIRALPHDKGGYFDLTTDQAYNVRRDMTVALEKFGIDIETSHHEVALGQHEISFKYSDALKTADNAVTFKTVLKAIAQQNDLYATFMPKPIAGINGSGMHVHQSLFDIKTGKNAFYDEEDKYHLSKTAYNFIAGQLAHIKAMSAILSPTINSYKRLVPGYEAPVYICWGRINRSALVRIPRYAKGKYNSTRAELRCPDPSSNIYLTFAVMLAAGLDGIKRNLAAPKPVEENLYKLTDAELKIDTLPKSLEEALGELKKDKLIQDALGKHTYEKFLEAKTEECDEYNLQVSKWELDRYLEVY